MSIENIERLASAMEKMSGFFDKIPRFLEMVGVAFLAGRAAESLGGDFTGGAIGGVVADGLVHSNLPHNQIGAVPLATYFTALGLLNLRGEAPVDVPTSSDVPDGFAWILRHFAPDRYQNV